jgi:hypothetical protein
MNRFIISILLLISFDVQSQNDTINIPLNEAGKAEFINVLKIENASKESLFQKVAEYLQYNKMFIEFKNDKGVLKSKKDEQNSKSGLFTVFGDSILIRRAFTTPLIFQSLFKQEGGYFMYDITVRIKEGKIKYIIDNITFTGTSEVNLPSGADLSMDFPKEWKGLLNNYRTRREWKSYKKQAVNYFTELCKGFENHLKTVNSAVEIKTKKYSDF